jgi:hypothetical protein
MPRFYAAGANGTNMRQCWSARRKGYGLREKLVEGTPPRGLSFHSTDKAGYI